MKLVIGKDIEEDKQILYVLELVIDDKTVVKIGITSRQKVEDRIVEILTSHFHAYRKFPSCYPKRFRRVPNAYDKEQELLKYFRDRKYISEKAFGGHTELVDVPLDEVVDAYEWIVKEGTLDDYKYKCSN